MAAPTTEINKLVAERDKTHGKYEKTAAAAQEIKKAIRLQDGWRSLEPDVQEMMDMIASKMGRILGGNPDFPDHFADIAGYATLVYNRLTGKR